MSIKFKCTSCGNKIKVDDAMGNQSAECPSCNTAIQVPPSKVQVLQQQQAEKQASDKLAADAARRLEEKKQSIVISTGGIPNSYKILTIIFAAGVQKYGGKGLFTRDSNKISNKKYNTMIEEVYNNAISIFREKGAMVGADAIINSKFDIEQIELAEKGVVSEGNALRVQVFCTGTAVKFV
jgi:uncharacterized protein YbjQ (UPF0145 family)/DNA-directed RNA polymerase subunit RPC12/RpoP